MLVHLPDDQRPEIFASYDAFKAKVVEAHKHLGKGIGAYLPDPFVPLSALTAE